MSGKIVDATKDSKQHGTDNDQINETETKETSRQEQPSENEHPEKASAHPAAQMQIEGKRKLSVEANEQSPPRKRSAWLTIAWEGEVGHSTDVTNNHSKKKCDSSADESDATSETRCTALEQSTANEAIIGTTTTSNSTSSTVSSATATPEVTDASFATTTTNALPSTEKAAATARTNSLAAPTTKLLVATAEGVAEPTEATTIESSAENDSLSTFVSELLASEESDTEANETSPTQCKESDVFFIKIPGCKAAESANKKDPSESKPSSLLGSNAVPPRPQSIIRNNDGNKAIIQSVFYYVPKATDTQKNTERTTHTENPSNILNVPILSPSYLKSLAAYIKTAKNYTTLSDAENAKQPLVAEKVLKDLIKRVQHIQEGIIDANESATRDQYAQTDESESRVLLLRSKIKQKSKEIIELKGTLKLLTPTDVVEDKLKRIGKNQ